VPDYPLPMWPAASTADGPVAHAPATCSDYPNQKAAQQAADTVDADGGGIYCESLPCPCSTQAGGGGGGGHSCTKPTGVQRLVVSKTKYPNIRKHFRAALRRGWPVRLVVNRCGADARRDRLLEGIPTKDGFDRDEYPPAVGRGRGKGLERGRHPRGWRPTCGMSLARRTARMARRLARSSLISVTARGSGTSSVRYRRGILRAFLWPQPGLELLPRCGTHASRDPAVLRYDCSSVPSVRAPRHGRSRSPREGARISVILESRDMRCLW
jgi:hypothetical protein